MRIALDVDGVLLNFEQKFMEVARKTISREFILERNGSFDIRDRWSINPEEFNKIMTSFYCPVEKHIAKMPPMHNTTKETLNKIQQMGDVYLVTGINPEYQESRLENLKQLFDFEPKEIICTGYNPHSKDKPTAKREHLLKINPDCYVDDLMAHLLEVHDFVKDLIWIKNDYGVIKDPQFSFKQFENITEWADELCVVRPKISP